MRAGVVWLDAALTPQAAAPVLGHEIAHLWNHLHALGLDEDAVDRLGCAFVDFLQRNPGLAAALGRVHGE